LQRNQEMARFFDRLAATWAADETERDIRDEIVRMASFRPGSVILDVGCGKGVMVPHLLPTNPGCLIENDLSAEMIRLARGLWLDDRVRFLCGDILDLELPPCDAAILFNCLPHFQQREALAKKLARSLKPDGTVVIAHSRGREAINAIHEGGTAAAFSTPLLPPAEEFENFRRYFRLVGAEDSPRLYLIKLARFGENQLA